MIIAICNHKGGTGKTTTTINLGCALVKKNKRVLLIDLDPQGNLSYSLGIDEDCMEISTVFTDENKLENILIQKEGMSIAPSNMNLADIELSLQSAENRAFVLKEILKPVVSKFDYILIDCPPSRSLLTVNALSVADKVITTALLDVLSVQGLKHIVRTVYEIKESLNDKIAILGILAVNVDTRKKLSGEVLDFIKNSFDITVFKTYIRTSVKVAESPSHGQSIFSYAPKSSGAKDYLRLANELLKIK